MNKRHYEHTLPNIRGSLSNTYVCKLPVIPSRLFDSLGNFFLQVCHIGYVQQAVIVVFQTIPEQQGIL